MDQVHVIRHKVLVEKVSVRRVAREMGVSRNTVRKYLEQPAPKYGPRQASARPVSQAIAPRVEALLAEAPRWTGGKQRLTATRLHRMLRAHPVPRVRLVRRVPVRLHSSHPSHGSGGPPDRIPPPPRPGTPPSIPQRPAC